MAAANGVGESHDLRAILSGDDGRDFLLRNNGDQVKVGDLEGKTVGLYFSAHWCGPCRGFTPELAEAYAELAPRGFEVVFISGDEDEASFGEYFSEMPWLAVPIGDSAARTRLDELFEVTGIPHLVLLDGATGKVLTAEGVGVIRDHGSEAYPFTPERLEKLTEEEAAAKRNQSLRSLLTSASRDYVMRSNGDKVSVSEMEGKTVGLYFCSSNFGACADFTPLLKKMYEELQKRKEKFEVVVVPLDDEEAPFEQVPWLTLPFKDKMNEKLARYFDLRTLPTLVIIAPDGKTLLSNAAQLVEDHGIEAYPFTPEKIAQLEEMERAKAEAQTLESLLVSGELDYVIGKDGTKVPVSELVGKNILLYFSAHWCPPCRAFLPKLIEAYHEIKAKDSAFEVVFISSDEDQSSFDDFFATMPWLALPFGDDRKKSLNRTFKICGIPSLVAIGPSGRTVTKDARALVAEYGSAAYPFTEERLKELEAAMEETAKGWPEKMNLMVHEHELVLTRRKSYGCAVCHEHGCAWSFYCEDCDFDLHPKCAFVEAETDQTAKGWPEKLKHELHEAHELVRSRRRSYFCDGCEGPGQGWSFYCPECDFDLHPKCALEGAMGAGSQEEPKEADDDDDDDDGAKHREENGGTDEGYVCDGEVCYKA